MLRATWKKDDKKARVLIFLFSIIVFIVIVALGRIKLNVNADFDVHLFARLNAIINSCVALLLLAGLATVKRKEYLMHKKIMMTAIIFSIVFLLSYICHHLLAGETRFGDANFDGIITPEEKASVSTTRIIYYFLLGTHILLAAIILPLILFTAYRSLIGEYARHKKLARITWPIWFYVAVTGVVVYAMISPYYH